MPLIINPSVRHTRSINKVVIMPLIIHSSVRHTRSRNNAVMAERKLVAVVVGVVVVATSVSIGSGGY